MFTLAYIEGSEISIEHGNKKGHFLFFTLILNLLVQISIASKHAKHSFNHFLIITYIYYFILISYIGGGLGGTRHVHEVTSTLAET